MEDVTSQSRGGLIDGRCLRLESSDCLLPGLPDDVALNCLARASRSDYHSLSCVNKKFHELIGSGDLYELRKRLGIVEHWVYLSCALNRWVAFNPVRNKWMALPKIPSEIGFDNVYKPTLAVDSELLVFGREVHFRIVIWKYIWIRQSWVKCEVMNCPRLSFGSGSFGSIAVVAGGVDENKKVLNSAELYDSSTGKWETLPNMNYERRECSGFFINGKFYVIGGMSSHGITERGNNMVRKYDKAKNTWDVLGGVPVGVDIYFNSGLDFLACGGELLVVNEQRDPEGKSVVIYSWCPKSRVNNGTLYWKVVGTKKNVSVFKYNCAVMGC